MDTYDELLRIRTVEQITGRKKPTIYRDIKRGQFPPPVKIGGSAAWSRNEIQEWIAEMKSARVAHSA